MANEALPAVNIFSILSQVGQVLVVLLTSPELEHNFTFCGQNGSRCGGC